MKKLTAILLALLLLAACGGDNPPNELNGDNSPNAKPGLYTINKNGMTVDERYPAPQGYSKVALANDSFGAFLRQQELKPYGDKVKYYDGRTKNNNGIYDSVFRVDIGKRDLHQCADAVMLLRAEYLYSLGLYDEISFNFVSGFKAEYRKWMEGYRIHVDGNQVNYYMAAEPTNTYESFRKYMDMVMAYASTLSLTQELTKIATDELTVGDVFIIGGSPGHAIIVVDAAENAAGDRVFLLAQSYMPAQETQILLNPNDASLSPWYSLKDQAKLITPEWTFELNALKRF